VFSRIGDGVRRAVQPITGTEAGRAPLSVGAGGDTTLELDRAAEAVVFAELAGLGERGEKFSVLSEEAGRRDFGAEYPLVLVDPVDGSLNAKQGLPLFGVMLAVLDGPVVERSEEHTSELQSRFDLVCRLLLEKKNKKQILIHTE